SGRGQQDESEPQNGVLDHLRTRADLAGADGRHPARGGSVVRRPRFSPPRQLRAQSGGSTMRRRRLVLLHLLVVLWATSGVPAALRAQAPRPPNILWISTEDLSPRIGAYGDQVARTPNLDRLAREGLLFENAYTTAAVCA